MRRRQPERPNVWSTLVRIAVVAISLYAFRACPGDTGHEHLICNALEKYREVVLQPLVIGPVQRVTDAISLIQVRSRKTAAAGETDSPHAYV